MRQFGLLPAIALGLCTPAVAQIAPSAVNTEAEAARTVSEAIAEGRAAYGPPPPEPECGKGEGDEIIICASAPEDPDKYRLMTAEAAEDDYARRTMNKGNPQAPNFAAPPCVPSLRTLCIKAGSPPPPAILIDVTSLPQAPPGSDADRISRGLPPLGRDAPGLEDPALLPAE